MTSFKEKTLLLAMAKSPEDYANKKSLGSNYTLTLSESLKSDSKSTLSAFKESLDTALVAKKNSAFVEKVSAFEKQSSGSQKEEISLFSAPPQKVPSVFDENLSYQNSKTESSFFSPDSQSSLQKRASGFEEKVPLELFLSTSNLAQSLESKTDEEDRLILNSREQVKEDVKSLALLQQEKLRAMFRQRDN